MNTAMRNAFINSIGKAVVPAKLYKTVVNSLQSGMGTKSRAMWANMNPPAYDPCGLKKEAC